MPLRHAAIAACLDRVEAQVVEQAQTLYPDDFWLWFGAETAPMLETTTGDHYAYARDRIDRMLRSANVA